MLGDTGHVISVAHKQGANATFGIMMATIQNLIRMGVHTEQLNQFCCSFMSSVTVSEELMSLKQADNASLNPEPVHVGPKSSRKRKQKKIICRSVPSEYHSTTVTISVTIRNKHLYRIVATSGTAIRASRGPCPRAGPLDSAYLSNRHRIFHFCQRCSQKGLQSKLSSYCDLLHVYTALETAISSNSGSCRLAASCAIAQHSQGTKRSSIIQPDSLDWPMGL